MYSCASKLYFSYFFVNKYFLKSESAYSKKQKLGSYKKAVLLFNMSMGSHVGVHNNIEWGLFLSKIKF